MFILLASIPLLAFPYKLLHASFNNFTALLYPCAPCKYTVPLVGASGTNVTFPLFISSTFHLLIL